MRCAVAPSVALVVARSRPGNVIGREDRLPWHLKSDLRRFRAITLDHAIIMGRRTYASIGHPLPQRLNIVLSSAVVVATPASVLETSMPIWVSDMTAAMRVAEAYSVTHAKERYFVVGGSRLFRDFLDLGLIDRVYLTEVLAPELEGDTHFDKEFQPDEWTATNVEEVPAGADDDYPTVFRVLDRRVQPSTSAD